MIHRFLVCLSVLAVAAVIPPRAQAQPAAAKTSNATSSTPWKLQHFPDGQPDLQGIWTNATITPMERPAEFANKPFLTEQEASE
jgi:hypothetical protein